MGLKSFVYMKDSIRFITKNTKTNEIKTWEQPSEFNAYMAENRDDIEVVDVKFNKIDININSLEELRIFLDKVATNVE